MIFIVCQRVILIYFSAKSEMVARLRGHDRFFCHVRRSYKSSHCLSWIYYYLAIRCRNKNWMIWPIILHALNWRLCRVRQYLLGMEENRGSLWWMWIIKDC